MASAWAICHSSNSVRALNLLDISDISFQDHQYYWKAKFETINASFPVSFLYSCTLTERIDEFAECYCEAAPGLVESEEQHGDILRRPYNWSSHSSLAVIRVTLVQRKRMVLCAGKLLTLHHPAIKYLKDKKVALNTILL